MGRLLDEDDVVDWLLKRTEMYDATGHFVDENVVKKNIKSQIAKIPSAQREIIRCKDCKHWTRTCGDEQWGLGDCDVFDKHLVMCKGYCAWAERREDGNG